ncbi:MAG: MYXO-CTERM sorting domain-containing protein [Polyangiaceae bacterium]
MGIGDATRQGLTGGSSKARVLLVAWLSASGVAACGLESESLDEPIETLDEAIINGTVDNGHGAVVAVLGQGACTGTIIHTDPQSGIGHVLTAAHCTNPQQVVMGSDYTNPTAVFPVIASLAHPSYNGQVYDFQMVRISGVSSSTPVIPAMSPSQDNLGSGTQVRHVGYGKAGPAPGSNNTVKRQILGSLDSVSSLTIDYNQPSGGPCSGDSGGPQLTVGGTERVAGVTSYGDQSCASFGVSGRVSAVYDSFIVNYINGAPVGPQTCDGCLQAATTGQGACINAVNACFNNTACGALVDCINNCSTQACVNQCAQQHSGGVNLYNAIFTCVCDVGCPAECGMEAFCNQGSTTSSSSTSSTSSGSSTSGSGGTTSGAGGMGAGADPTGGVGAAGGGDPAGGDDGWVAPNTPEQQYDGTVVSSGCSLPAGSSHDGPGAWLLAGLALVVARRRKEGA